MSNLTRYQAEVQLGRAAMGDPFHAHAAFAAGVFNERLTVATCVASLSAAYVWILRGGRPLWDQRTTFIPVLRKAMEVADAWHWDGHVFEPSESIWLMPYWGPIHIAEGIAGMIIPSRAASSWSQSFEAWQSISDAE